MLIAKYCKEQGMDKEQYRKFKKAFEEWAARIYKAAQNSFPTGVYFSVVKIMPQDTGDLTRSFIIQELKKLGMEFINNSTEWRI